MSVTVPASMPALARRVRSFSQSSGLAQQLGTASAQWVSGVGNLLFALLLARILAPAEFAVLGAFLSGYVLLHLPAAGIGAGAALSPTDLARRRHALFWSGIALGVALAAASPLLARAFSMPVPVLLALATAAPGAAVLGLERGARFGTGGHRRVAAGLLVEPTGRLGIGVAAAVAFGTVGAAIAVTAAGYAALAVTRAPLGSETVSGASAVAPHPGRVATAVTFGLFAVMQQQDLLVAKLRLAPEAAGTFTLVSTAAGAVAFATATVPLVVLGGAGKGASGHRLALAIAAGVAVVATLIAVLVGDDLLTSVFGSGFGETAHLFPRYVAAMALLGVGRVLAARRCTVGQHRYVVAATAATLALHVALLVAFGSTAVGVVTATFATTAAGTIILALPGRATSAEQGELPMRRLLAWARAHDLAPLAALVAAATAVRVVAVRGLWVDEAITVAQARLPFGAMLEDLRITDVHPPLHHAIVWLMVHVVGDAEWVVRLPSVIAGVLLVPVAYGLARELYGRRTGLVAALLVSVAPFLVWYSQEARMYSLLVVLATASLWAQVRAMNTGTTLAWAGWALATAAMLWTQWFAVVPVLAGQVVLALTVIGRRHDRAARNRLLIRWALAVVALAALVAPLLPFALEQLGNYGDRASAATAPSQAGASASSFAQDLSAYALVANALWALVGYHSDEVMTGLGALWPLLLLLGLGALGRGRSRQTTALLVLVAIPTALFLALGTMKRDLFELRYFAFVVPVVLVLVARTITNVFPSRNGQLVAASLAGAVLVGALADQQLNGANPRQYDFEGALAEVTSEAGEGDVILYEPDYLADVVTYYAPGIPAQSIDDRSMLDDDERTWLVATTRVMDAAETSGRVGRALAELEADGWEIVEETEVPNVRVWELNR